MDARPTPAPDWPARLRGRFLVFEGPDGSGKTTQMRRFKGLLDSAGVANTEVREPGGTNIGEEIRQVLLHTRSEMTLRCEMLLYMASRAQLVEERIRPALAAGQVVIADRYLQSTLAYQGTAGGIPHADITAVANASLSGCFPDLVLIFDVDETTAAGRINPLLATATRRDGLDRIERRDIEFHRKVREGYRAQARANPATHRLINAARGPEAIWEDVVAALGEYAGGL
ncbi:MAG TPA: dTMP kinase [Phycisphaerales bacterium]|nr:dTMP kinase [Phycisphaerales bacterium]